MARPIERTSASDYLLALLRLVSALLFFSHGLVKMAAFPPGAPPGLQPIASLDGLAGLIELLAGILLAIGWLTRPAAFLASGTMAAAYWIGHAPQGFFPVANGGDSSILFCFVFLYLAAAGAGPYSIDNRRGKPAAEKAGG